MLQMKLGFASLLLLATQAGAATISIDFETLPNGNPVAAGTEITNQYASLGVLFESTNTSSGAVQITNVLDVTPTPSSPNYLAPGGPLPNNGGTLVLDFTTLVKEVGSFFIGDAFPVQVTAYDSSNSIVGVVASDGAGSVGPTDDWIILHSQGIARVELAGGFFAPDQPDGWGIDDLRFVPVPEPGTLSLFAICIGITLSRVLRK